MKLLRPLERMLQTGRAIVWRGCYDKKPKLPELLKPVMLVVLITQPEVTAPEEAVLMAALEVEALSELEEEAATRLGRIRRCQHQPRSTSKGLVANPAIRSARH